MLTTEVRVCSQKRLDIIETLSDEPHRRWVLSRSQALTGVDWQRFGRTSVFPSRQTLVVHMNGPILWAELIFNESLDSEG